MKTSWSLCLGVSLLGAAFAGETTNAPSQTAPPAPTPVMIAPDTSLTAPPLTPPEVEAPKPEERGPQLGGAGPAILRARQPLQMFNPAAPKEYGDGTQFLSLNPHTGEPEGVTLLSFRLFSKSSAAAFGPKPPKAKKLKSNR